jgi:Helix-turn-helix domain
MESIILTTTSELKNIVQEAVSNAINGTNNDKEQLLNSADVMQLCKISHTTLQKWRDKNKIPFSKTNNKILYKKADVLTALYSAAQ